jgi:hypothetical protein
MPQCDRTPSHIHLLERNTQLLDAVHRLRRERLVDLEEVDFGDGQVELGEEVRDGVGGADAVGGEGGRKSMRVIG